MSYCTVGVKEDVVPTTPTTNNITASDINDIVDTVNSLLEPIYDDTTDIDDVTKDYMNAEYVGQNGAAGQIVVFSNINLICQKIGNDPNGDWNSLPYNPLT